jgi:hypothetical protein
MIAGYVRRGVQLAISFVTTSLHNVAGAWGILWHPHFLATRNYQRRIGTLESAAQFLLGAQRGGAKLANFMKQG